MRRLQRVLYVLIGTAMMTAASCGACEAAREGFNEGYCPSFRDNFVKSCTATCKQGGRTETECATLCEDELPKQKNYAKRCLQDEAGSAESDTE